MNYQNLYNALILHRRINPLIKSEQLYTERHHIIPSCLGGQDSEENLIVLTAREHFIAHLLLSRIHPDCEGLSIAIFLMSRNPRQGGKLSSKQFQKLREIVSRTSKTLWDDDVYREKVSNSKKLYFRTLPEGFWRDRQLKCMSRESTRIKLSEASKRIFENQEKVEEQRNIRLEFWKDQKSRNKMLEAHRRRVETTSRPWMAPRAQPSRTHWGLAQLFWSLSKFNMTQKAPIGYVIFSNVYDCSQRGSVYQKMIKMFSEGWIPNKDPLWLEEFGDYKW